MGQPLDKDFFASDTLEVARALLGASLTYGDCTGVIVETEAYKEDEASHAVTRPNKGVMLRETYGRIYIYLIYGMHYCLNVTTEKEGVGAVLIRAVEPRSGIEAMHKRRGNATLKNLTNGPAKLFNAFGIKPDHHGENVGDSICLENNRQTEFEIVTGPRIGISRATELQWRFCIKGNEFLSR